MKKYCFNYAIEGVHTFLPTFVCVNHTDPKKALLMAKQHIQRQNQGSKTTVFPEIYPPHHANPNNLHYLDEIQTVNPQPKTFNQWFRK